MIKPNEQISSSRVQRYFRRVDGYKYSITNAVLRIQARDDEIIFFGAKKLLRLKITHIHMCQSVSFNIITRVFFFLNIINNVMTKIILRARFISSFAETHYYYIYFTSSIRSGAPRIFTPRCKN